MLVDPGVFSTDFDFVEGLDAVLVTHQHPDHLDVERLPALLAASPGSRLLVEPGTVEVLASAGVTAEPFAAGERVTIGGRSTIEGVGGQHAVIYREIPRIGNTGLVLRAEGAPTVFHPGDMIDTAPEGIDLLAAAADRAVVGAEGDDRLRPGRAAGDRRTDPRRDRLPARPRALPDARPPTSRPTG